jgi:hypothetical protein
MIPLAVGPDASLADLLSARARTAAQSRLALDIIGGGAIAATSAWARPLGWLVWCTAGLCFFAYGTWAFAERHLAAPTRSGGRGSWFVLRSLAALLGVTAFVTLLFAVLGVGLGTWIS